MSLPQDNGFVGNHRRTADGNRDTHAVDISVVSDGSEDCLAIVAPARCRHTAIQSLAGRHTRRRRRTVARDNREMFLSVSSKFSFIAFKKGDPFAIGRPFWPRATAAIVGGCQKLFRSAGSGVSDIQLGDRIAVGIVGMIAHEGDPFSVRRPGDR